MTNHKCPLTGSATYAPCSVDVGGRWRHAYGCIHHYREDERKPDSNATLGLEQPEYRSDAERRPGIGWLS